jgi:integrase
MTGTFWSNLPLRQVPRAESRSARRGPWRSGPLNQAEAMTIIERKTSYGVRVWRPGQEPEWVGSFNFKAHGGKREAKAAAKRAEEKALKRRGKRMTVKALVTAYLADYEGRHKLTSTRTAKQRSAFLVKHLGSRYVDDLTPVDALEWKAQVPPYCLSQATTIFNWANRKWITDKNPFAAIYEATEGRSKQAPPTKEEFAAILEACSALGDHADQFRSFVRFAWGSGLRPGELFLLEWEPRTISHKGHTGPCSYIDLQNQSIHVNWRVFHSDVDLPKSNEVREVALLPPAAEALQGHPRRSNYVFVSKRGGGWRSRRCRTTGGSCWRRRGWSSTSISARAMRAATTSGPSSNWPSATSSTRWAGLREARSNCSRCTATGSREPWSASTAPTRRAARSHRSGRLANDSASWSYGGRHSDD